MIQEVPKTCRSWPRVAAAVCGAGALLLLVGPDGGRWSGSGRNGAFPIDPHSTNRWNGCAWRYGSGGSNVAVACIAANTSMRVFLHALETKDGARLASDAPSLNLALRELPVVIHENSISSFNFILRSKIRELATLAASINYDDLSRIEAAHKAPPQGDSLLAFQASLARFHRVLNLTEVLLGDLAEPAQQKSAR